MRAANGAILRHVAPLLGVARGQVALLTGRHARDKIVLAAGITPDEVMRRLTTGGDQQTTHDRSRPLIST